MMKSRDEESKVNAQMIKRRKNKERKRDER